jgi:hypothetical protein
MGWKVQVVDGGLSDMYNTSTLLADNQNAKVDILQSHWEVGW